MRLENNLDKILIIDFGSQFTQLIARKVRELNVFCEIISHNKLKDYKNEKNVKGIILSGGPLNVYQNKKVKFNKSILSLNIPILGICFGHQIISKELGGKVKRAKSREFGLAKVTKLKKSALTKNFFSKKSTNVWMSHGDEVIKLPKGFKVIAKSSNSKLCMIENIKKKIYGIQFHPEVSHTVKGKIILKNFVIKICKIKKNWTSKNQKSKLMQQIKEQVGNSKVICALSGGVDSSVTATLIHKAIGNKLTCIYVDHGLMRLNESEEIIHMFKNNFKLNLIHADERDYFLKSLKGVSDPELKRKIIGNLFIEVFTKYSEKFGDIEYLAQGTLYPDVIESVSFTGGPSETIKSHHNVGGLPKKMKLKLVEPLRELFKDEVRQLGFELGLPKEFIGRHPFPGPGLAIRCPGEVTSHKIDILRKADSIFIDQIKKYNLYDKIWQAFVVLLPVRSVGVMGDGRTYDFVCSLRAVTSVDGMTADFYPFDNDFLGETSNKIINEVKGINRVTYDITSKPPGTIEWE